MCPLASRYTLLFRASRISNANERSVGCIECNNKSGCNRVDLPHLVGIRLLTEAKNAETASDAHVGLRESCNRLANLDP